MSIFMTVSRAESAAVVLPDEGFEINFDAPPTRLRMRTNWRDVGVGHPVPQHLWIEGYGEADSLDTAIQHHAGLARGLAHFASFLANAAVEPLELELAYDASPSRDRREFRQTFVKASSLVPRGGRIVPTERLRRGYEAWLRSDGGARLSRALFQYALALRTWRIGSEFQCLDHLWIAGENLAQLHLKRRIGERTREELAHEIGLDVTRTSWSYELDSWSRRELVFQGDEDAYKAAKQASDGYEHGYMDITEVQALAVRTTEAAFGHVRRSIADLLSLAGDDRDWLLDRRPLDVASTRRHFIGALVGTVEDPEQLARSDQEYPLLRWTTSLKSLTRDGDSFNAAQTENFTVVVGPGVRLEPQALEARGRRHPDHEIVYSQAQPEEGLDLDDLSLPAISRFLDRAVKAVSTDLNEIFVSSDKVLILGMLSNGIALAESAQRLLADRRAVEALEIAARLFEGSCLARWLLDNQELSGQWFEEWLRLSNADTIDLHRAGVWSGRRSAEDLGPEPVDDSTPKASLIPWPPTEDWLRDQAAATDRSRAWWLWRLNRSISWSVLSLQSRVLEGDALRFSTREPSLDELAEVAAFVIESLAVLRSSYGRVLGLGDPDQLADRLLEAQRVLESLPRPATVKEADDD